MIEQRKELEVKAKKDKELEKLKEKEKDPFEHNEKLIGIDRIIKKLLKSNDKKLLEKLAFQKM